MVHSCHVYLKIAFELNVQKKILYQDTLYGKKYVVMGSLFYGPVAIVQCIH